MSHRQLHHRFPRRKDPGRILHLPSLKSQLKTSLALDTVGEKEIQSTTTMKYDRSLLSTRNKQIMSTVLSKKPTNTPLVDQPSKVGPKLSVFEKYDLIKKKN